MKLQFNDLVKDRLVQVRRHDRLPISLYKYHRKVFYKGLFDKDERLRWARGIGLNDEGDIVLRPFFKWYNFKEKKAGQDWHNSDEVLAVRKFNGFMLSLTSYEGELIYASTGTFDSSYVKLGQAYIESQCDVEFIKTLLSDEFTFVFEICAKEDPHIIDEKIGVYLIGVHRNDALTRYSFEKEDRSILNPVDHQDFIRAIASGIGAYCDTSPVVTEFGDIRDLVHVKEHEGYMIYNLSRAKEVSEPVIKMKTPYYLITKLLARHSLQKDSKPNFSRLKKIIDEEYYDLLDELQSKPEFFELDEQSRISYLRNYYW